MRCAIAGRNPHRAIVIFIKNATICVVPDQTVALVEKTPVLTVPERDAAIGAHPEPAAPVFMHAENNRAPQQGLVQSRQLDTTSVNGGMPQARLAAAQPQRTVRRAAQTIHIR